MNPGISAFESSLPFRTPSFHTGCHHTSSQPFRFEPRHYVAGLAASTISAHTSAQQAQHCSAATLPPIEGFRLQDITTLRQKSDRHELLLFLQKLVATCLMVPLDDASARQFFTPDVQLVVQEEKSSSQQQQQTSGTRRLLASSVEELVSLHQALLLAQTATTQATDVLLAASPRTEKDTGNNNNNNNNKQNLVQGRLGLNNSSCSDEVLVEWHTRNELFGMTRLYINSETNKVSKLAIESVKWRGVAQDATTIGSFLSSSRQVLLGWQESPLVKPFLAFSGPIFEQVKEEWLQQQLQKLDVGDSDEQLSPLFWIEEAENATGMQWYDLDDRTGESKEATEPSPGSKRWLDYVSTQYMLTDFCTSTLPALANLTADPERFFASNATLVATDGTLLLSGAGKVTRYISTFASFRQTQQLVAPGRPTATLVCDKIRVRKADFSYMCLDVHYTLRSPIPRSTSKVVFCGVDQYNLSCVENGKRCLIDGVKQKSLSVEGLPSRSVDPMWLTRRIAEAIESGRLPSNAGWLEWLSPFPLPEQHNDTTISNQSRRATDDVALFTFRVMENLHEEVRSIFDVHGPDTPVIPALPFMSKDVRLTGYLDETLLRGQSNYQGTFSLLISTIQAGMKSDRILLDAPTEVRTELTQEGNVRLSASFTWKLLAPGLQPVTKVDVVSEYRISDAGDIRQHRVIETRLNGRPTPGDIFAAWIRGVGSGKSLREGSLSFVDLVTWFSNAV